MLFSPKICTGWFLTETVSLQQRQVLEMLNAIFLVEFSPKSSMFRELQPMSTIASI